MSGAIAASVTFPLEVVRRQLQAGALPGKTKAYASMGDCVVGIMRERVRYFAKFLLFSLVVTFIIILSVSLVSFATFYSTTNAPSPPCIAQTNFLFFLHHEFINVCRAFVVSIVDWGRRV